MLKQEGGFPAGYDQSGKSLYYDKEYTVEPIPGLTYRSRVLRFGEHTELQLGEPVQGRRLEGYSLKEYIRTSFGKEHIPVYIFDEHNHALFAWCEALKEGRIEKDTSLLTFDEHNDGDLPLNRNFNCDWSLPRIALYARWTLNNMFIEPAQSCDLIQSVYWMQSRDFHWDSHRIGSNIDTTIINLLFGIPQKTVPKQIIVDIDLDYFLPITDVREERREVRGIRKIMAHAGVITVATSPGYIPSDRAIRLAHELLRN